MQCPGTRRRQTSTTAASWSRSAQADTCVMSATQSRSGPSVEKTAVDGVRRGPRSGRSPRFIVEPLKRLRVTPSTPIVRIRRTTRSPITRNAAWIRRSSHSRARSAGSRAGALRSAAPSPQPIALPAGGEIQNPADGWKRMLMGGDDAEGEARSTLASLRGNAQAGGRSGFGYGGGRVGVSYRSAGRGIRAGVRRRGDVCGCTSPDGGLAASGGPARGRSR